MVAEEGLPRVVAAEVHALDFGVLEGVHGDGADEGDVHAQAAVGAGAVEADEGAELGGGLRGDNIGVSCVCAEEAGARTNPLGRRSATVAASFVSFCFGEVEELW